MHDIFNHANVPYIQYTSGNLTTYKHNTGIVNPAHNGTDRDKFFRCGQAPFNTDIWKLGCMGSPHSRYSAFPAQDRLRIYIYIYIYIFFVMQFYCIIRSPVITE
jgi:hypothetical protein